MQRYLQFDSEGNCASLMSLTIAMDPIPEDTYQVSDPALAALSNQELQQRAHLVNGEVSLRPAKPSVYHAWNVTSATWIEDVERLKWDLIQKLHTAVDTKRFEFMAPGNFISDEYILTRDMAQAFVDNGGEPHETVQVWAEVANMTPLEAAQDILGRAAALESGLTATRSIRLKGKAAIENCSTGDEARNTLQTYLDQLALIIPTG